ncbi:MAG: hypothetical protein ABFS38_10820 [Bacteroidota bacterium]
MKKLLILLFVLGISLPSFGGLNEKDVVGKWKYKVEIEQGTMTGILKFEIKEGKLTGEVITDAEETFPFTKVEIKENNILYFELAPDYEVITATLTVENKKFEGMIGTPDGEIPITGEKVE